MRLENLFKIVSFIENDGTVFLQPIINWMYSIVYIYQLFQ